MWVIIFFLLFLFPLFFRRVGALHTTFFHHSSPQCSRRRHPSRTQRPKVVSYVVKAECITVSPGDAKENANDAWTEAVVGSRLISSSSPAQSSPKEADQAKLWPKTQAQTMSL
jgi:hypothetical protein